MCVMSTGLSMSKLHVKKMETLEESMANKILMVKMKTIFNIL